ncbi:hypothetical protein CDD83_7696 [Cordyceps sp. RAO-2017]|nr:hypothetical protein CDD83_7696 [Cordyceps sp. RAO-2017]
MRVSASHRLAARRIASCAVRPIKAGSSRDRAGNRSGASASVVWAAEQQPETEIAAWVGTDHLGENVSRRLRLFSIAVEPQQQPRPEPRPLLALFSSLLALGSPAPTCANSAPSSHLAATTLSPLRPRPPLLLAAPCPPSPAQRHHVRFDSYSLPRRSLVLLVHV